MIGKKFMEVYNALNEKEKGEFQAYLSASFTGASPSSQSLAAAIRFHSKGGKSPKPDLLHQAIFPNTPLNLAKLRSEFSLLYRFLSRFLAHKALSKSPPLESVLVLRELADRGLAHSFSKYQVSSQKQLAKRPHKDRPLCDYLVQVEGDRFTEHSPRHQEARQLAIFETLETFYLLGRLKLACAALNNQEVVDLAAHWPELAADLPPKELRSPESHPTLGAYYAIMKMLHAPDIPQHYEHLKAFLMQYAEQIPPTEAKEVFTYAQNHCIRQINRGRTGYLEELFFLYQNLLDHKLLLENGALSPWHMKNIVSVALRLEKFDWVEDFLQHYLKLVPKDFRENARVYNFAKLHFHRKNYSEAKKLLLEVEYEDIFYNLDAKTMLLKIYTEEEDELALDAFSRSFMAYLRRMPLLSAGHRDRYINLVRYIQLLCNKGLRDRPSLLRVQAELEEGPEVADVNWLLGTVEKLLGGK